MNVLCLNRLGLGAAETVANLHGLLRRFAPKVALLSETKKSKSEMDRILHKIGDFFGIFVDAKGWAGGLALHWDKSMTVDLLSCSFHHIDVSITLAGVNSTWRFTGIYGWSESQQKWKNGHLIMDLKPRSSLPWLVGGDLNEIFYHSEKKGGPSKA